MATPQTAASRGFRNSDIVVAGAVIMMILLMVIPLPPRLLDVLLTINISLSLVILLVTMYIKDALEFSAFPTLLLVMTLYRLSLNVSSTRLILGNRGEAGEIIRTFGEFVIGGNAVVGFIIFLILVVIQFLVITKGAERVSEVAARFTLDAMPGKQMSIDADLNAGLINDQEAKERRKNIQREADFYGAMDGASKFVKGDAIASLVITAINVIGGFIIGLVQNGASDITQVLRTYTVLSVGDGLVTQIPALLISVATGITVTRAASESSLGQELVGQMFNSPRALALAAAALLLLALLGMPPLPMILLASILGGLAWQINRAAKTSEETVEEEVVKEAEEARKPENVLSLLQVDLMELELGYSLIPLVDSSQGGDLLDRVVMIRRQCALELGIVLPPIRMRDNMQLRPNSYVIKIKGVEVASGTLMVDHYLAMNAGLAEDDIAGIDTVEPAFGLPAKWIPAHLKEEAELKGYTVVDPSSVLATHLTEIIKSHAHEILGRQDVKKLLDNVKETNPAVVEELVPDLLNLGEIQKVLANLLREKISIRDLVTILETLADQARATKDIDVLTEYVRQALSRQITRQFARDGQIAVLTLAPELEQQLRENLQQTEHGSYIALDPMSAQKFYTSLQNAVNQQWQRGIQPVLLCPPLLRIYIRRIVERVLPDLPILSYNELEGNVQIQAVGTVTI
ncbi:flagellar biosynthesis protein FlhA [Carboxydocella sporoproducens DSM 16521]|uniref:Flagellar biosynthesis protein FlhA n=3 Tax=Carboxydocella TaxID=178898 RepID=A0A1T4P9D5_9FIRM|nr:MULTISPECIES: flagellar biosynthesis protein FlhA [Carboxydocella]AVX20753.1 flagellar biosynthesis protein FlhA [Carboxydocella thermautotrophica]GAW28282.1 flagellar biosynthesis protein FlhA [Carboxydocella sp. ULO1]SJZ88069.1 flagellar biosynthesis protein FlhA [Carboxydocella sporoproducens DSM 16521]